MRTVRRRLAWLLLTAGAPFAAGQSAADVSRAIREITLDPAACYRVRDLSYYKDDIKLYFNDGYLIFSKPVLGERLTAVFTGETEGGDGEILLLAPNRAERQSLAKFTGSPNLNEHFRTALLMFTDRAADDLLARIEKEGRGREAPEMGPLLAERWDSVIGNVSEGFTLRMIQDLLSPARPGGGFFLAVLAGNKLGNFDVLYDPRGTDQILAAKLTTRNDLAVYDVWTTFPARSFRTGVNKPVEPGFSIDEYKIDATIDETLGMKAAAKARIRIGALPQRALLFEISRAMVIRNVRLDGIPAEVFSRESAPRGRALKPGENDAFLVIAPGALAAGSTHELEFEHEGNVITSPAKGVYYVGARSNWYPSRPVTFSRFDLTFRYPRRLTLVTPGEVIEERLEGEMKITHRRTGPIHTAGFNLGEYEKFIGDAPGFTVEVYGNKMLEPALRPVPRQTILVETTQPPIRGAPMRTQITTILQSPPPPDPLGRMKTVAIDVASALQFFSGIFGPPPLKSLTVSPIPDTFGQGFPGLIYLSTMAYLKPEERPASVRGAREQAFFSDIIQAHEVAHQWWGNLMNGSSYQDEWLIEALANYSALMWLEKKKGAKALDDVLEDYRNSLLKEGEDGKTIESAGPLTWGYRLAPTPQAEAWRAITYEKGSWILHMLRQRIGNDRFVKMLGELRKRYEYRTFSTRDLQALAKEFRPPRTSADVIDSFFENWVYATGVPSLKVKSSKKGVAPAIRLTGTVEQSGVDPDFSVDVPVEIQFAKAAPQVIWVRTSNEPVPFGATLKELPLRVTIPGKSRVLMAK